ncbi:MAG: hypothetical protein IKS24_07050 [Bacteroidaceae bacterium]|nr:hypothetical protein [Bacteroidaceae bacterium]
MEIEKKPIVKEQDIIELFSRILKRKKFILIITAVSFVVGSILAFTSVKQYTAEVMVSPESAESTALSGNINSLASMVGLDFSTSSEAIYPLLYPDIINSLPFLTSLIEKRVSVTTKDGIIDTTYAYYQAKIQRRYWFTTVIKTPKRLVKKAVQSLIGKKIVTGSPDIFDPYRLSEQQIQQIESLKNKISVFVDKKTEVITLSFKDSDPEVAALMVHYIESELETKVVDYRTRKAQKDCEYMYKLYEESKKEYEKAQAEYADFVDHNRNITLERVQIERQRLEDEKDLKNTLYSQWAQQLLLSQAKLQLNTPVFTIIKPAAVPPLPSSIRRLFLLAIYTVLGFLVSVGWVLLKEPITAVFRKLKAC